MSGNGILSQVSYSECCKGGLHLGELINYVCMEKSCREKKKSLGCSVCMEEEHAACRKAPLKYMYKQLQEIVEQQQAAENGDSSIEETLQSLILSSRQSILESVLSSTNALISKAKRVQNLCVSIFDGIEAQTKQKINTQHSLENILNQLIFASSSSLNLQALLDQLFNLLPEEAFYSMSLQQQSHLHHNNHNNSNHVPKAPFVLPNGTTITGTTIPSTTTTGSAIAANKEASLPSSSSQSVDDYTTSDLKNLQENLLFLFKQISSTVSTKNDAILAQLNLQEKYLLDLHNDQMLVHNLSGKKKLDLTFSATEKHGSISLISPSTVKSNPGSSSNYKFALTNSNLPMNCPTKFAFKMKTINSQNWIAIGVALKKVIKAKNYSFSLSLGHGAYMISSNSGSWSHSESANNNVVKSFDFSNGSIVECLFDPVEGFVHFALKDNPAKKYKLLIDKTKIDDDTYHPCVLFYYPNDEVEIIYPYS